MRMLGGFVSSADRLTGQGASAAAELRCQAQDSVRDLVTSAGAHGRPGRSWVVPLAATAAVAAAACAPVVWPLLAAAGAGTGAAVVGAALTQVGGVGSGLLSEAVIRAWDNLRSSGRPDAEQADLRDALAAELKACLTLNTRAAAALRDEVAGVLRGVDAVQVALTATVEESAAGVREVLVRGLRELGEEFTEFGWVLDEVSRQLAVIAEDVARTAAATREVADNQQQTLVELAMLRQEARSAFRYRAGRPGPAVVAGPSADEERAAALDAGGVPVSAECPYPGLAAFQPKDAERFFGRGQLTAELVARVGEQLARPGLLMVLGPSGSGKSSLLRAGLLPAVAAGVLPARGSWAWPRDLMTPGRHPLMELATRIASLAGIPAGALEADLRIDPARITGAIRQALLAHARRQANTRGLTPAVGPVVIELDVGQQGEEPGTGSLTAAGHATVGPRLVLIVDQFEEVFTQCTDEHERHTFIKALCAAAGPATPGVTGGDGPGGGQVDVREAPALVVIGIRADFYARSAAYPELAPHLQDHQVLVGAIDEAGLREAIEKPAAAAGLVADAALVEVLLADLGLHARRDAAVASIVQESPSSAAVTGWDGYAAGRLALLSYALQQTWRNREGRRLTVAGYRATGSIDGAVAQAADKVYDRLGPAGRDTVQRMLLRLVDLGEGAPDTRRRVTLAELTDSDDTARATLARAVLAELIDARLVTADEDAAEITHETLLTAWPRLRQWLTDDRAGLRIHRDLTDAARDWQQEGHDLGRLFRGARLVVARDWAAHHSQDLNAGERAFLAASEHDRLRTTRRRRFAAATLAVLTVLSLTAAGVAFKLRSDALTARDQAIASQITVVADQLTATDPSLAAQLDVAANQFSPSRDRETRLIATSTTPLASRLTGPTGLVSSVAFSPDGRTLAAGSYDDRVWLWNLTDPARPIRLGQPLTGPTGVVFSVAFSPDGRILAAGSDDTVWRWDVTDPARPIRLGQPLTGPTDHVSSVAFSPDGRTLAAGSDDDRVWRWNLTDPARPTPLGQPLTGPTDHVSSVAFSPDGRTLAAGSDDDRVWRWDVTDLARPIRLGQPLTGPTGVVSSVAFSPDGRTLAAGGDDRVWRWDLMDLAHPIRLGRPLTGPTGVVFSVAFSPDGRTLAAGGGDRVWRWNLTDPARPTPLGQPLTGPTGLVFSVAFSPDGRTLAVGNYDQTIRLWNLPSNVLTGPRAFVGPVAFSPDGRTLAVGGDHRVRLLNLTDPARPTPLGQPLTGPTGLVFSVAFSPDGRTLAASDNHVVWLWNLTDPTPLGQPLTGPTGVDSVAFSPDGRILAAGGDDDRVWLWDLADPARPIRLGQPLTGPTNYVSSVAFSPDGRILAAGSQDDRVWLWDLADQARPIRLGQPLTGPTNYVSSVAFSPDGRTLAAGSDDRVWRWDLADSARPTPLGQPLTGPTGFFFSMALSRDGRTLAAGGDDRVWLWDLTDPARPTPLGQPLTGTTGVVSSMAFSPDGRTLAADSNDGTVWLWNLDVDDAIQRICATTSNTLTSTQWKQYFPQLPYSPPCLPSRRYSPLVH